MLFQEKSGSHEWNISFQLLIGLKHFFGDFAPEAFSSKKTAK
jgi:hypothetical protein